MTLSLDRMFSQVKEEISGHLAIPIDYTKTYHSGSTVYE